MLTKHHIINQKQSLIYDKLKNIKFDENRTANIEKLNLKIYNSDFYLKKGKI